MEIFPIFRLDLEARPDEKFDLVFRARERTGWRDNKWQALFLLFRDLPVQIIHPEFFNIRRQGVNSVSLVRWDSEKRRFRSNLSGPLTRDPRRRYQLNLDLRNENWDVRDSSASSAPLLANLNLRKYALSAGVTSIVNGRWDWSTGVELSNRSLRNVNPVNALSADLLANGIQLKHVSQLNYKLAHVPEKRFTINTGASTEVGRIWSRPSQVFAKLQGSLRLHWFPQASNDYEIQSTIRAGKTLGQIPFDELFMLGVERDNDLWLRGHPGTRNGRKGGAPLGRNYVLTNWALNKKIYSSGVMTLRFGPFLDTGRITDSAPSLGSRRWLWDVGGQAKIRVLGLEVAISYGRGLRSSNHALFVNFR